MTQLLSSKIKELSLKFEWEFYIMKWIDFVTYVVRKIIMYMIEPMESEHWEVSNNASLKSMVKSLFMFSIFRQSFAFKKAKNWAYPTFLGSDRRVNIDK